MTSAREGAVDTDCHPRHAALALLRPLIITTAGGPPFQVPAHEVAEAERGTWRWIPRRAFGRALLISLVTAGPASAQTAPAGDDRQQPPATGRPPVHGTVIQVTGSERLEWDYTSSGGEDPNVATSLEFVAYVNEDRRVLVGAECVPSDSNSHVCRAPLPALPPGRSTVRVAAVNTNLDVEGPTSEPIDLELVTAEGSRVVLDPLPPVPVAGDPNPFADVVDLEVLPDGRRLVAGRQGSLSLVEAGSGQQAAPLQWCRDVCDEQVLAAAIGPDFVRSRHVFVALAGSDGIQVARYTMTDRTLASRAVLLHGLPMDASNPAAALEVSPDGLLFLALGEASTAGRPDPLEGALLRLGLDGSLPGDGPAGLPIWARGARRPVGLVWTNPLAAWLLDAGRAGAAGTLTCFPVNPDGSAGQPVVYRLPERFVPHGLAAYRSTRGADGAVVTSLVVAGPPDQPLLRVMLDASGGVRATEWWPVAGTRGRVAVAGGVDGDLHVASEAGLVRARLPAENDRK